MLLYAGCPLSKIVSGGQTGVDRAALAVAVFMEIPHGGWCPKGRRSEDGSIPQIYQLKETEQADYSVRTEKNVVDSDGTLVLHVGKPKGGTALTIRLLNKHKRTHLLVDLAIEHDYQSVRDWLEKERISVLNVAGPRESSQPGITMHAEQFLANVLTGV